MVEDACLGWVALHNIVMRLTDHSRMGDALWFEVGEDLGRFSINEFCMITGMKCVGSIYLAPAVDNRLMIENSLSSKRRLLKKVDKVHYSITGFHHTLLVWAYESIPTIAGKFMTKHVEANSRMLSWTSTDNMKFDCVMLALTTVGEKHCFVMMPTDKVMKEPCVAQLCLNDLTVVPQVPRKTTVTQPTLKMMASSTLTLDKGVKAAMDFLNSDKEDKDEEKEDKEEDEEEEENEDDE
ncbi:hypothetical protein TIFTF001_049489 [Ficus carica]|uniref:DUF1985 domain-containing protein n=1 Tax=Ficus carica TaxID=3494 RepID=A0AA88CT01_FICCA|nr:hypothetical protein TIFTF001_049489 [Ficus carica]